MNLLPIKVEVFKPVPSEQAWANTLDDHKRYLGLLLLVTDGYYITSPATGIGSPEYEHNLTFEGSMDLSVHVFLNVASDTKDNPAPVSISISTGQLSTLTSTLNGAAFLLLR